MSVISPPKLSQDDYAGDWAKDMPEVFRQLNKFNTQASDALGQQISLVKNLGWQVITLTLQTPDDWVPVTFTAGWSNRGGFTTQVRKDNFGVAWLDGEIVGPAATGTAFTVPTVFWPEQTQDRATVSNNGADGFARMFIDTSGNFGIRDLAPTGFASVGMSWMCADRSPYVPSCFPVVVSSTLSTAKASAILLAQTTDLNPNGGAIPVTSVTGVSWVNGTGFDGTKSVNSFTITDIPGLLPKRAYKVTLFAIPTAQ